MARSNTPRLMAPQSLVAALVVLGLSVAALSQPVPNRLPLSSRVFHTQSIDQLVLEFAAERCRFPTIGDTIYTTLGSNVGLTLLDVTDEWSQPFVYNHPAVHGNLAFDLYSVGQNGVDENGAGDDVANWVLRDEVAASWAASDPLRFWSRAYADHVDAGSTTPHQVEDDSHPPGASLGLWRVLAILDLPVFLLVLAVRRMSKSVLLLVVVPCFLGVVANRHPIPAVYEYTKAQVYYLHQEILEFRANTCAYPTDRDIFPRMQRAGIDSLASLGAARDYWGQPFVLRVEPLSSGSSFAIYSIGRNGVDDGGQVDDIGFETRGSVVRLNYAKETSPPEPDIAQGKGKRSIAKRVGIFVAYLDFPIFLALIGVRWRTRRG